jgi:hypothetical protein
MACASAWTALAFSRQLSNARSVVRRQVAALSFSVCDQPRLGEEPSIVRVVAGVALAQVDTVHELDDPVSSNAQTL